VVSGAEELKIVAKDVPATSAEPESEPLAEQEGWQILKAALLRELGINALRIFLGLAALGTLACALIWSYDHVVALSPQIYEQLRKIIAPVAASAVGPAKAQLPEPPVVPTKPKKQGHKHSHHQHHRKVAVARAYRRYDNLDHPSGGHIEYSDGTITEYSWH
jgi:hypothetical protein